MLIYPFRLVFGRVLPAWAACTFICEYFTMFVIILQRIKLTVFRIIGGSEAALYVNLPQLQLFMSAFLY